MVQLHVAYSRNRNRVNISCLSHRSCKSRVRDSSHPSEDKAVLDVHALSNPSVILLDRRATVYGASAREKLGSGKWFLPVWFVAILLTALVY